MLALLGAVALLLIVAGAGKVVHPADSGRAAEVLGFPGGLSAVWARLFGAAEVAVGAVVIVVGGAFPAALAAASFTFLAVVAWRLLRVAPAQDCGCFGRSGQPITRSHLAVDIGCAVIALIAVGWPQPSWRTVVTGADPLVGGTLAAMAVLLTWLLYAVLTTAPRLHAGGAVR